MNVRIVKAKFRSLITLLDYRARKTYKKRYDKKNQPVKCSTQGGDFLKTNTINAEIVLP